MSIGNVASTLPPAGVFQITVPSLTLSPNARVTGPALPSRLQFPPLTLVVLVPWAAAMELEPLMTRLP